MARTIKDLTKNIIRTETIKSLENTFDMAPSTTEKQSEKPKVKASGRGGARKNSGRKVGSTQKLSGASILAAIADADVPFEIGLAEDYARARAQGDLMVVQRYQQMFLNKVVADKQEVDMTSNGQTMTMGFSFPTTELPEWNDGTTKH